jgi:hypothetical protein
VGTFNPPTMRRLRFFLVLPFLFAGPVACIPYAVGSTAQPLPAGETRTALVAYRIPRGLEDLMGDSTTDSDNRDFAGIDVELRRGIGDGIDVGLRVPSASGVIATYKRRLVGGDSPAAGAVSVMPGLGVVNWMSHAHAEMTVMASTARRYGVAWYGGARVMQVVPLERDAATDSPTAGGYFGLRFGGDRGGLAAEVGVYHDRSALGMRRSSTIVVPSLTVDGDLFDALRDAGAFDILGWFGGRSQRGSRRDPHPVRPWPPRVPLST